MENEPKFPTTFDIREILLHKMERDALEFEGNVKIVKAITLGIDSSDSCAVSGREKFIWVREYGIAGAVTQVFNPDTIALSVNLPCLLRYNPKEPFRWEVYGVDWAEVYNISGFINQNFGVGSHASNHEWPDYEAGYDPNNIYPRSLIPLRTSPGTSGLLISVVSHRYVYAGEVKTFNGIQDIDLSSYQPASGAARLVVVYLDKATKTIKVVAGNIGADGTILPSYPSIPGDSIISAAVRLDGDQTVIAEEDITDLRMVLTDTEALGLLKGLAAVETEVDYTLSNHELRIDGLGLDLASEIESLDSERRKQLAIVETEVDYTLSNHELRIGPDIEITYALPLTMGLIMALPALRGFWPGSVSSRPDAGNQNLGDISGNGQHFVQNNTPVIRYVSFPYVKFNGSSEWYSITDTVHWDIFGTEAGTATANRGLLMGAWAYFNNTASAAEYLLSKREGSNKSYQLRREQTGEPLFGVSGDGTVEVNATGATAIPSAGWNFMVGMFTPSTEVAVFNNGVWATNTTSVPSSIFNSTADLFMAGRDDSATPGQYLLDGNISMAFICAARVEKTVVETLWNVSRHIFGV